eukprot:TRINITY_DN12813_c0_g1_i1.p1 TRINITY_DN12813_c0_g1~~TRINITY_DN12813_c0_g1_i1.p1  ORF type:complete len:1394 (-),score=371.65 TRINITY_DN12813_c0_g1_i1:33-4172(-)
MSPAEERYMNTPVKLASTSATVLTSWSSVFPLLAIAQSDGTIGVYNEEGELLEGSLIKKASTITILTWHPSSKLLIIGWQSGTVTLFNAADKSVKDDSAAHLVSVMFGIFNNEGTRLVTGDKNGSIVVWNFEQPRLASMCSYRKGVRGAVCAAFRQQPGAGCEFVFSDEAGLVRLANDQGTLSDGFDLGDAPAVLLYNADSDAIVAVTRGSMLAVYRFSSSGQPLQQDQRVKLAAPPGGSPLLSSMWCGPQLLARLSHENQVRCYSLASDENSTLVVTSRGAKIKRTTAETLNCMSYNSKKKALAAGTREGRVVVWQAEDAASKNWEMTTAFDGQTEVSQVAWGPGTTLLSMTRSDGVTILTEATMFRKVRNGISTMQIGADQLLIERHGSRKRVALQAGMRLTSVDADGQRIVLFNGKRVAVYQVNEDAENMALTQVGAFNADGVQLALHLESIYVATAELIKVYNFGGVVKYSITLPDEQGHVVKMDVGGNFLAVVTDTRLIKVWDLSRREAKQSCPGRVFDIGEVLSIRCNSSGSMVSILGTRTQKAGAAPQLATELFVYDVEGDKFLVYNFQSPARLPQSHFWDEIEPRLLAVTIKPADQSDTDDRRFDSGAHAEGIEIATLFATNDIGVRLQDTTALPPDCNSLLGVRVPYMYLESRHSLVRTQSAGPTATTGREPAEAPALLTHKVMRDFEGMETVDDVSRDALVNFSFHLTTGNMDEAYKAVKLIKSARVWENMASMCVKTQRLDVADICLGNMGHARGAYMLRMARETEKEPEAQLAMLAIQLGMIEDAEKLYTQCNRYDLLNLLQQAAGKWDRAIKTAETHDRIHLRTTHFSHAKHLESIGDVTHAIKEYELAEAHRREVPRMLFELDRTDELGKYVTASGDKELMKWWAQFMESHGSFQDALRFYQQAEDHLSVVRVLCFQGQVAQAAQLALESNSPAACYHLARQYEQNDPPMVKEAMDLYTRAGRVNHAIRLAKQCEMTHELLQLAVQAPPASQVDAAKYFQELGIYDKAVFLYHKGGDVNSALELCFRTQQYEMLGKIADDLGKGTSPELLRQTAQFFFEHHQQDKAVKMLIFAGDTDQALELCVKYNVPITEDMAEGMTPPKVDNERESTKRIQILRKIAQCAKKQNQWHLACKKYTQAGDKMKAMKALLRSGDTEKIIIFANVARTAEIFVIAANYLQTLDWRTDGDIMKSIIAFYNKAKAYDSLSIFYDACAQVEVDDFRDYDKALVALKESAKHLQKVRSADRDQRAAHLQNRIGFVEKFVEARNAVKTDASLMVKICSQLLQDSEIEAAVRVGDVFALLIEFYYAQNNMQQAYKLIEEMRARQIVLGPYLDSTMVQNVYRSLGVEFQDVVDDEEVIDEEVE